LIIINNEGSVEFMEKHKIIKTQKFC